MSDPDVATLDVAAAPPPAPRAATKTATRRRSSTRKRSATSRQRKPKEQAPAASGPSLTHEPTEQYTPEQQRNLHETLLMLFGVLALTMAADVRPTQDEINFILEPAERIVLRRVALKPGVVNPDLYDVLLIAIGVISYASRVRAGRTDVKRSGLHAPIAGGGNRGAANAGPAPQNAPAQPVNGAHGNGRSGVDQQLESLFRVVSASTGGSPGNTVAPGDAGVS